MEINQDIITNAATITGGAGALIFALQKAIKSWSADRNDMVKTGVDTDLFTRMSSEIKRLSETNQAQEKEIDDLRSRCASISEDFVKFKLESMSKDIMLQDLQYKLTECHNQVLALQRVNNQNGAQ